MQKKHIVVVGGGTGTHAVLTGLKAYTDTIDLTAVVAMTDSGGSTGRLRDEFGYLPVGDVRMALVALATGEDGDNMLMRKLFLHRFHSTGDISGHNFGNLFLVALTDILGSEEEAIRAASRVLRVCGVVLPVTKSSVDLVAQYDDGKIVHGEHHIDNPKESASYPKIIGLSVTPSVSIHEKVVEALTTADTIVFGPGDLYTSIIANCVIPGFRETIAETRASLMYVANLMTRRGQTTHMDLADHVSTLGHYLGRVPQYTFVNTTPFDTGLLKRYRDEGEFPVKDTGREVASELIRGDFVADDPVVTLQGDVVRRSLIRHDSLKLAKAIIEVVGS